MYILFLINLIVELINKNLTFNIVNTCVLIALIIFMVIGVVGLLFIINYKNNAYDTITIIEKQNLTDQHFLNYFSLFVLLALTFDLSKICFVCVFVVLQVFIGIVYIKNNIFYVNPLLNILGYSFYDIVYENEKGERKEQRIFFKGELDTGKRKYKLYVSNKNLNFLQDLKKRKWISFSFFMPIQVQV